MEAALLSAVVALVGALVWIAYRLTGRIDRRIETLSQQVTDHGKQIERVIVLCEVLSKQNEQTGHRFDRIEVRLDRIEVHVADTRERIARLEGARERVSA